MSAWLKNVDVITLFVEDLERTKLFYRNVLGLPLRFENHNSAVFNVGDTSINMIDIPAAHDLIEPGTAASREAGSRFEFTVHVDDVDAVCAELATLGVTLLNGPVNRSWGIRTASFTDPGGHIWEIADPLPQAEVS